MSLIPHMSYMGEEILQPEVAKIRLLTGDKANNLRFMHWFIDWVDIELHDNAGHIPIYEAGETLRFINYLRDWNTDLDCDPGEMAVLRRRYSHLLAKKHSGPALRILVNLTELVECNASAYKETIVSCVLECIAALRYLKIADNKRSSMFHHPYSRFVIVNMESGDCNRLALRTINRCCANVARDIRSKINDT